MLPGKKIAARVSWNIVNISIGLILILVIITNLRHSRYNRPDRVIEWDVKSYYAWLPAVFIYKDISLEFRKDNIEKFGELIWPVETPEGRYAIVTTMGMAFLYSPFFAAAHLAANLSGFEADGYSRPYRFALTFGALFYLWAGMIFLKRILRRFHGDHIVAATIVAVVLGTNLFYYSTYEAAMTHVYNFTLIAGFILLTIRFYEKPSLRLIIAAGVLAGLITLVRPVNIIVLVPFFLWGIKCFGDLRERLIFFRDRYIWVLLMAGFFVLVWVPQFIYWRWVSGSFFYFSYGELGGRFFFGNPQIFNILFSVKKGWLVYTPLMIFSIAGIIVLIVRRSGMALAIALFTGLNIYILSSWWNWWYGGGFGLRSFVDCYALLAIPFAAFLDFSTRQGRLLRLPLTGLMAVLLVYNLFQTRQYVNNAIHWWWMNKEAYRETFLRLRPTDRFWEIITIPDHDLARQGIYREIRPEPREPGKVKEWQRLPEDHELLSWILVRLKEQPGVLERLLSEAGTAFSDTAVLLRREAEKRLETEGRDYYEKLRAIELIVKEIEENPAMVEYIEKKARRNKLPYETMLYKDAEWIYKNQR
jgi:hypothetical protein